VLGAFRVLLARRGGRFSPLVLGPLVLVVGIVVGANAASDPLLTIGGLVPFTLGLAAATWVTPGPDRIRPLVIGLATLLVIALAWIGTDALMSALNVVPEPGQHTGRLASATKVGSNVRLWWQSITLLGNGAFLGRDLDFVSGLAVVSGVLSLGAVALLPRLGWRELRVGTATGMVTRDVVAHDALRRFSARLGSEAIRVGQALGYALEEILHMDPELIARAGEGDAAALGDVEARLLAGHKGVAAEQRPSMAQDMIKGRRTEIDFLNGFVVARGKESDVAAPGQNAYEGAVAMVPWFCNLDAKATEWTRKFEKLAGKKPSFDQAAVYSAVTQYLVAVKRAQTDDPEKVVPLS